MLLRQVVPKKKIYLFSFVLLWFKPRTPGGTISDRGVTIIKQTMFWTIRQGGILTFMQLGIVVLEQKIFKHILIANPGPPGIDKCQPDKVIYQISNT